MSEPAWRTLELGEVVTVRRQLVDPSVDSRSRCVGLEHIDSGAPWLSRWGAAENLRSSKAVFRAGDVLYGKLRPYLDKAALAEWDGMCSTDILVLKPREAVLAEYLVYLLHTMSFLRHAEATTTGVNHPRTSWQALSRFRARVPPLAEQRAIAAVLDTVQRAIAATERVIAATRELKRSLMRHLFTYGPVPIQEAERVPLKETEIGLVPETWEIARLGHIAMVRGGKRVPKGHAFSDEQTPFPYVRVVDLCDGCVDLTRLKYLTREDRKAIDRYTISKDDVYISIAGSIGLVGLVPPELDGANLTENAAKLTALPNVAVDKGYLARFLASDVGQREVLKRTTKTSQPKLALARIREIPVALPPLSAQRRVAGALGVVDQKLQAEKRVHVSLSRLFDALLRDLMSGAVRVSGDQ